MARKFKVKIDGVTLPGAGMMAGAHPDAKPFAHRGDYVFEGELGEHLVKLYDEGDERTLALFEEVGDEAEPEEEPEELSEEPWEGYDSSSAKDVIAKIQEEGDDPDFIEKVKQYESLRTSPRKTILAYEPGGSAEGDGDSED